jgi:hypothetical protein
MKMKNRCLDCDGMPVEMWIKFSKNKKGIGILMAVFNIMFVGEAYSEKKGNGHSVSTL